MNLVSLYLLIYIITVFMYIDRLEGKKSFKETAHLWSWAALRSLAWPYLLIKELYITIRNLYVDNTMPEPRKSNLEVGDRVKITGILPEDPHPLDIGDKGLVKCKSYVFDMWQYDVEWDSGRSLFLLENDPFQKIPDHDNDYTM